VTSGPAAWDARDYARNSSAQARWADELMNKLGLRGDERILDIGSGDGKVTAELARRVRRGAVLGIDSSADMVELAQSRLEAESLPNLSFRQMDAARLELPRTFDVAFSSATLHWVRDHVAVLRGVRACLRRGGRILFQMGGRGNAREVAAVVDRLTRGDRWGRWFVGFVSPYHFHGTEEYERWLPACGYRARRVELIPRDMQHEGPEGLRGWLRTTWFPYAARLPEAEREEFWGEVIGSYLAASPPDAAGRTHVAMVRLEVEAEVAEEE
jgi:trans-aconitate 2-methyltransferase